MPPPADDSSIQKPRRIYVRPRTRPHISGGRPAAGSQCAYSLGSCAMGQTDERIALFHNAAPRVAQ